MDFFNNLLETNSTNFITIHKVIHIAILSWKYHYLDINSQSNQHDILIVLNSLHVENMYTAKNSETFLKKSFFSHHCLQCTDTFEVHEDGHSSKLLKRKLYWQLSYNGKGFIHKLLYLKLLYKHSGLILMAGNRI